jgi:hypothetical protein
MTRFVQEINDDLNYELLGLIKDIRKELKKENRNIKFGKSDCIENIVYIALKKENRQRLISEIVENKK